MTTKEELLEKLNKLEPTKAEDAIEQCMFLSCLVIRKTSIDRKEQC